MAGFDRAIDDEVNLGYRAMPDFVIPLPNSDKTAARRKQ
jgi:hypothetical protein